MESPFRVESAKKGVFFFPVQWEGYVFVAYPKSATFGGSAINGP
jgi:hypothetical protein